MKESGLKANSNHHSKIRSGLSDPLFASKLDSLERISFSKLMFTNNNPRNDSLYDYQKIQSTAQGS
jgi:hypothetical protein